MPFRTVSRRRALLAFALSTAALLPGSLRAQAPLKVETFTGTTVNLAPGAAERLKIDIFRWASDADRDTLFGAIKEKGVSQLPAALEKAQTAGYVWGSGSLGYSVKYAHRSTSPEGGERIVLVTDRRLGSWGRDAWRAAGQATGEEGAFTVVELRLNKQGRGEGKMSFASKVAADAATKTLSLESYAAAPVMLKDVRRGTGN